MQRKSRLELSFHLSAVEVGNVLRNASDEIGLHKRVLAHYLFVMHESHLYQVSGHGSTVHFVTEELDGGPRILQGRLAVDSNETAEELCARVQAIEHQIYPQAANWFGQGRLQFRSGQTLFDGKPLDKPVVRDFS